MKMKTTTLLFIFLIMAGCYRSPVTPGGTGVTLYDDDTITIAINYSFRSESNFFMMNSAGSLYEYFPIKIGSALKNYPIHESTENEYLASNVAVMDSIFVDCILLHVYLNSDNGYTVKQFSFEDTIVIKSIVDTLWENEGGYYHRLYRIDIDEFSYIKTDFENLSSLQTIFPQLRMSAITGIFELR